MTFTISVAGASGYAGGELLRLAQAHPELRLGALAAGAKAGQPVPSDSLYLYGTIDSLFAQLSSAGVPASAP